MGKESSMSKMHRPTTSSGWEYITPTGVARIHHGGDEILWNEI